MSQVTSDLSTSVSTLAAGPATTSAAPTTSAAAPTTSPVTSASPSSSSSPTTATSSASNGSSSSVTSIGTTASTTTSTPSQSTSTFVVPVTATTSPVETTSGGSVFTVVVTSTSTPSSPNSDSSGSTSFWNNTGAVVGVFTVVGLIGLALLILIITTAIRRRRAVKFDKEIAAAAADAAATTRFPFDDYSDPSGGGGGGGGYGYSDNSHGTYAQPPMRPVESYGMTEMSQYEPYAAGAASGGAAAFQRSRSRKESEVGTPGIAGVGAGNLAREPSRRAPYHAFAGPNPQDLNDPAGNVRYPRSTATQDVLEAAGLVGTGAAALAHDGTGALVNRRPSDYTQNTHRSGRSHGYASSSEGGHPSPLQPGYRQESNIPQRSNSRVVANASDPYGVHVPASYPPQSPSPPPRNPLRTLASSPPANDYFAAENEDQSFEGGRPAIPAENRVSLQDDTDYAQEPRVLRVMNE